MLALTWIVRRAKDEKWFFFSAAFNDPSAAFDEEKAVLVGAAARSFLASQ